MHFVRCRKLILRKHNFQIIVRVDEHVLKVSVTEPTYVFCQVLDTCRLETQDDVSPLMLGSLSQRGVHVQFPVEERNLGVDSPVTNLFFARLTSQSLYG